MKTEEAINQLTKALKNKAYRETWEANIAMSFKDEYALWRQKKNKKPNNDDIHTISNKAANRFIDLLIKK